MIRGATSSYMLIFFHFQVDKDEKSKLTIPVKD